MPTITYEPVPFSAHSFHSRKNRSAYHYKVLIDGEWRATFDNRARWNHAGFDLTGRADEKTWISRKDKKYDGYRRTHGINRDEFDAAVTWALEHNTIATLAEIERFQLITQAENDDRAWEADRERHRAQVHREMMQQALQQYIDNADGDFPEHVEAARVHLTRIR